MRITAHFAAEVANDYLKNKFEKSFNDIREEVQKFITDKYNAIYSEKAIKEIDAFNKKYPNVVKEKLWCLRLFAPTGSTKLYRPDDFDLPNDSIFYPLPSQYLNVSVEEFEYFISLGNNYMFFISEKSKHFNVLKQMILSCKTLKKLNEEISELYEFESTKNLINSFDAKHSTPKTAIVLNKDKFFENINNTLNK